MAFKPYCRQCNSWHTEQEGHMIDLTRLRKKTLPKALTPREPEERAKRQLPATAKPLVVEGEASQSSPSLDLEIDDGKQG